jgi:uncharacterized Ntn-hydrolase superfamily protein
MFGVAVATSDIAVGSRCIHVAPGVGAIITQAATNPLLGHLGLNLLRQGYGAAKVVTELAASDTHPERRQLGCLDMHGHAAARTGARTKPWAGHLAEQDVVAAANLVTGPEVVDAMFATFRQTAEQPLWERLLLALEAGKAAGGEPAGEQSAGLYVVDRGPYPLVDLRVDLHENPVAELRRIAGRYFPLIAYFQLRPLNPDIPPAAEWLATRAAHI